MNWKHYSLEQAATRFDNSQDFTIGIEEEFQILDPDTLELTSRLEELRAIAHEKLGTFVQGELIASEIEISTGKCRNIAAAEADLTQKRRLLAESASQLGVRLGTTGTHPFSDWKDQRILETHHYREVEERVRYCAWHNLTYGMHTHVGIRGRERMIAVFNSLRGYMPAILALSANSPFS
ncbi:MAG: glutamate-cysteine ligase family protein, partial [Thermoleophilia bacterium]